MGTHLRPGVAAMMNLLSSVSETTTLSVTEVGIKIECRAQPYISADEWVICGGFIPVLFAILAMFWGLTFICEGYCVPAITVFCRQNKVSDHVSGSVYIGAGLSLPILFASYVGLFASNTDIGLGTVLGGNIFNQTINLAGSILVAPNRRLQLCKMTLTRQMIMYAISNILVAWAVEQDYDDAYNNVLHSSGCLSVPWQSSLILVGCYIIYCLVEVYFSTMVKVIMKFLPASWKTVEEIEEPTPPEFLVRMPSRGSRISPSNDNNNNNNTENAGVIGRPIPVKADSITSLSSGPGILPDCRQHANNDYLSQSEVMDAEGMKAADFILYKKKGFWYFLNPETDVWQPRYCTLHDEGFVTYRARREQPVKGYHVRYVDVYNLEIIDSSIFDFIIHSRYPDKRAFHFRAPDAISFNDLTDQLLEITASHLGKSDRELRDIATSAMSKLRAEKLVAWTATESVDASRTGGSESKCVKDEAFLVPEGGFMKFLYYTVHPLRLMIYYTTPDCRAKGWENWAILSVFSCVLWMGIASYIIIRGLDIIGTLIHVDGAIMGLTAGAWAASYPALWSSITVAKDSYGDIASCNAFGSNIFNNFLGLGLPWLTYSLGNKYSAYSGIPNTGVVLAFTTLNAVMVAFYIMVGLNGFCLRHWMAYVLVAVYVLYIFYLCYYCSVRP